MAWLLIPMLSQAASSPPDWKVGKFELPLPLEWAPAPEFPNVSALYWGPKVGEFRPTLYVTYIGPADPKSPLGDPAHGRDFIGQKRKWAASNSAVIERQLPFEKVEGLGANLEAWGNGVVYKQKNVNFEERAFWLNCQGDVYAMGFLTPLVDGSSKAQVPSSDIVFNAVRGFKCK